MNSYLLIIVALMGQNPVLQQKNAPERVGKPVGAGLETSKVVQVSATSPTMVSLKFKDQTAAQIVSSLNQQTGGYVEFLNMGQSHNLEPKYTLESSTPVPFWDAVDRFSALTHYQRMTTGSNGPFSNNRPHIQFYGPQIPAIDYGPAEYLGPLRVGPVTIHELHDHIFLKRSQPSPGVASWAGTFYAEISVLAELNLVAHQLAPVRDLQVLDDLGQSLVDSDSKAGESALNQGYSDTIREFRVSLKRAAKTSSKIALLRGTLPLEVTRIPESRTSAIRLEGSAGKTYRDGDLSIIIDEFKLNEQGQTFLKVTLRLEGESNKTTSKLGRLQKSRVWSVFQQQIRIVDSEGRQVAVSGGTGPSKDDSLVMSYTYTPYPTGTKGNPPVQILVFRADWVKWDVPFEFKDLPLP